MLPTATSRRRVTPARRSNWLLLSNFYDVTTMQDPQLAVTSVAPAEGAEALAAALPWEQPFTVTLSNAAPVAAFVWAETVFAGRWSDNGFMLTSPTKALTFYADTHKNGGPITAGQLKQTMKNWQRASQGGLWSLTDTSKEYTQGPAYPPLLLRAGE